MTEVKRNEFNEYQKNWLKALKSGKYKQCRDKLHDGEGYCCLGVLELLHDDESDYLNHVNNGNSFPSQEASDNVELHSQNAILLENIGLKEVKAFREKKEVSLTVMNDVFEYTFEEIADYIEKHPWNVFRNFDKPV